MVRLQIAPSEFWRMRPRHFWWLVAGLEKPKPAGGVTPEERKALVAMLDAAEKDGK